MELSVHIVTCGRLELFKECCSSVLAALPENAEVLVVINGDVPGTVEYLTELGHPQLRWLQVPRESLSRSRNRAFELCKGKILYYLDDDVKVPQHLFRLALEKFRRIPELAVLGGPNITPADSSWKEKLFGAIMTTPFAAPMVFRRYARSEKRDFGANQHNLIFCNLACRASLIPKKIRFREDLVSNQENLFLHLIGGLGLQALVSSELYVFHRRRKTWRSFILQIASYGCGRLQQTWISWKSCHLLFLIPPLLYPLVLGLMLSRNFIVLEFLCIFYGGCALVGGLSSKVYRDLGVWAWVLLIPLSGIVHLAYGFGWWRGLYSQLIPKSLYKEVLIFGHWQNAPN